MEREFQAVLAHLEQDLDGFIGASIVDMESGRTLAAHCVRPEFDLDGISTASAETAKLQFEIARLSGSQCLVEEILVLLTDQTHLCQVVSSRFLLFAAVESAETNLAMLKATVRARATVLESASTDVPAGQVA